MTTMTASNPITESKFNALKQKLRELFELDKSDLDFGIYRIMAAKNREVTEFLDRQLRDVVRETLASHSAGAADQIQADLNEAIEQARALGADPDSLPKVQELEAKLESAGGASAEVLEVDIYNHLLTFFSRYYDDGDFISKRRYKGETYAVPYSGEEMVLHWANKDQYYIKSGEWHRDYRFRIGEEGGKSARIRLLQATQEAGNNKEADDARRRFILCAGNPVDVADPDELILHFEFRVPTAEDRSAVGDSEATRIYGGNYDKATGRTKGNEREQFAAYAEQVARKAMPEEWRQLVSQPAPTDTKPTRTILGKHLDDFTARHTFDYFVHKDLLGFLRRELDFYIKNEVVRLDDIESLDDAHLSRVQGRLKAIRSVAGRIIELLSAIEDFQKKLWLKKKFVLNTSWLVTVDRVPDALRDVVTANQRQWSEWERLGFKPVPESEGSDGLFRGAAWGTRAYLDARDKLVVDTRLFDESFTGELLASEEVLMGATTIDSAVTGLLVNGDNFHGLNTCLASCGGLVDTIYIDPPYNTNVSSIPYKNNYRHAAFATMMRDRVSLLRRVMSPRGVIMVSIDDTERTTVEHALDDAFGHHNRINELIWRQNTNDGRSPTYSTNHEYVEVYARSKATVEADPSSFREPKPGFVEVSELIRSFDGSYPPIAEIEAALASLYREHIRGYRAEVEAAGMAWATEKRNDPWNGVYQYKFAEYRGADGRLVLPEKARETAAEIWVYTESDWTIMSSENKQSASTRDPEHRNYRFYEVTHPVTGKTCAQPSRGWKGTRFIDPEYPDRNSFESLAADDRIAFGPDESKVPRQKRFLHQVSTNVPKTVIVDYADGEKQTVELFGRPGVFLAPKHTNFVKSLIRPCCTKTSRILDCFGGSGSTAQAVIELNREDGGNRQFVVMEANSYFDNLIRPRVAKCSYSPVWKGGEPQTHDGGVSTLVKCFTVESYEDALSNLPAPDGGLLDGRPEEEKDVMLRYAIDLELGPYILDLDIFRDPWGYEIEAQVAGNQEIRSNRVDLVETFNLLIGLKVHAYGPIERYGADFEKVDHDDGLGRLAIVGRFRRDPEGPFAFQRVEGVLNDGSDTRVLVIWRTLTDDPEQDAAALDAWMERHREDTRERSEHRDYHRIYVNGPVTLAQPTQEIRTVFPIEQTFKDRMFADAEGSEAV